MRKATTSSSRSIRSMKLVAITLLWSAGLVLGRGAEWVSVIDGKEVPAPVSAATMGDEYTVQRILDEGKNRNQVMQHLEHLTKQIGPRLTGSSRVLAANHWTRDQYAIWGLSDPRLEQWGDIPVGFDRGPCTGKVFVKREVRTGPGGRRRGPGEFGPGAGERPNREGERRGEPGDPANDPPGVATPERGRPNEVNAAGGEQRNDNQPGDRAVETPRYEYDELRTLEFTTPSWTRGTDGPVRGMVIKEPKTDEEFEAVKEKLKGAWVLIQARSPVAQRGIRSEVSARIRAREEAHKKLADGTSIEEMKVAERVAVSGIAGYISASSDERVWTGPYSEWRKMEIDGAPKNVEVVVRRGDYDMINSRVSDGEPIAVEFDLDHRLFTADDGKPVPVYNTIAEIRGTTWPDQVVIVSAHLDSWDGPGSEGCTDNGTGSAVTLEAARILMAAGAQPKRTIRFINWTGEEQGLLGSAAYAKMHKAHLHNISAVFVDDGGTNYQGGLECIPEMKEMLAAATAPINNQFFDDVTGKPLNVNIRVRETMPRGGGSDHATFNAIGVPGFFWDEVGRADYRYGWHTQNDKLDLAIPVYLKQSSTCTAVTAYRLACADTLLPRAPKPEERREETRPVASVPDRQ